MSQKDTNTVLINGKKFTIYKFGWADGKLLRAKLIALLVPSLGILASEGFNVIKNKAKKENLSPEQLMKTDVKELLKDVDTSILEKAAQNFTDNADPEKLITLQEKLMTVVSYDGRLMSEILEGPEFQKTFDGDYFLIDKLTYEVVKHNNFLGKFGKEALAKMLVTESEISPQI